LPVLLHGLSACPLSATDNTSLDFFIVTTLAQIIDTLHTWIVLAFDVILDLARVTNVLQYVVLSRSPIINRRARENKYIIGVHLLLAGEGSAEITHFFPFFVLRELNNFSM